MKKKVFLGAILATMLLSCGTESKTEEVKETVEVVSEEAEVKEAGIVYTIDTLESVINWKGAKVLDPTYGHFGSIKLSSGELSLSGENKIINGNFIANMASIEVLDITDNEESKLTLEGHLKGSAEENKDHFFNVSEHPTASFEIVSVDGDVVKGNFTIKGITNAEEFVVTVEEQDGKLIAKTSSFKIDRTKYKVEYGSGTSFIDLAKDKVISDDITLDIQLVLNK